MSTETIELPRSHWKVVRPEISTSFNGRVTSYYGGDTKVDGAYFIDRCVALNQQGHINSDRYTHVDTRKVVEHFLGSGWSIESYTEAAPQKARNNDGYQTHQVSMTYDLGSDFIKPMIRIKNSHDGTTRFQLLAGLLRIVCLNGLTSLSERFTVESKHLGIDSVWLDTAQSRALQASQDMVSEITSWQALELSEDKAMVLGKACLDLCKPGISEGYAELVKNPRYNRGKVDAAYQRMIKQVITPTRKQDNYPDLWTYFNIIQERIMRGGLRYRSKSGKRMTTNPVGMKDLDKFNDIIFNKAASAYNHYRRI